MGVIWHKVRSDLWDNKIRTILAVLSIAVGVFAVGTVFGMVDQLLTGMDAAHRAVSPSHISMYLSDPIDRDTAVALEKIDGLEEVEVMNSASIRYKIHPDDEWEAGTIIMRDDYREQKYDVLRLTGGEWPGRGEVCVERLSGQYLEVDIGDSVLFELEKTDRALPITCKVRHPFVPPPQFGGQAYFFTGAQGMERFGVKQGEFSELLLRVTPYSREFAEDIASEVKDQLAKQNVGVAATIYQDPEEHWGRMFVEGINLIMQIFAVVSLFMSVVLILNTLTALITQQTNQIGIIKAIGGTTWTIVQVYLAGVLVYGLLSIFISLPLGALLAFGMTQWFLNLFNIDYDTFQFSGRAAFFQVIAAIAAPLVAALWPIFQGATTTVREAISSYGLGGGKFGSSPFDRFVERAGRRFLPSHYAMALGNMFRRKGRLALTQVALVTAGTMFLMVMSLSTSMMFTYDKEFERRGYDIAFYFEDYHRSDRVVQMTEAIEGVEDAELWFTHPASLLRKGQKAKEAGLGTNIFGVPEGSNMYRPLIVEGRWLQPGDGRVIVISKDTAEDNGVEVGDILTLDLAELGEEEWMVVGLYQMVFGGDLASDTIYAPQDALFDVTGKHNRGINLYVSTLAHNSHYVEAVSSRLKDIYQARNMDVYYVETAPELKADAEMAISPVIGMLLGLAVIVALVGGIGLMGSLSISVMERTREIGVMRAIGARTSTIMGMFIMEGMLQGFASWALSVPISFIIGRPLANSMGQAIFGTVLDYKYDWESVAVWLMVVVVISALSSVLPARSATRISVRESLVYD